MIPPKVHWLSSVLALTTVLTAQGADFQVPSLGYQTALYPDGHRAFGSRMADLDGDGDQDLVVSHWHSNPLFTVLRNDG